MKGPYSDKVMEHFSSPHNVGELDDADGVGEVGNPACGDIMKMYIKVEDDVIVDTRFTTFGCGAAIAISSMSTDLIKGKSVEEALQVTNKAVALLDAEDNWWGAPDGPSFVGPGTGDAVSANVDFDPWLGAEVTISNPCIKSSGS